MSLKNSLSLYERAGERVLALTYFALTTTLSKGRGRKT
jgi:hypothetical protein